MNIHVLIWNSTLETSILCFWSLTSKSQTLKRKVKLDFPVMNRWIRGRNLFIQVVFGMRMSKSSLIWRLISKLVGFVIQLTNDGWERTENRWFDFWLRFDFGSGYVLSIDWTRSLEIECFGLCWEEETDCKLMSMWVIDLESTGIF